MTTLHALAGLPELISLTLHFMLLSLLAVGGAITTAPDMQRYVVLEHQWITDAQFAASIAIGQAAPGPNVLFVAVIGWNVAGPWGALATLVGTLLPSSLLTLRVTRWSHAQGEVRALQAFKCGMAPLTLGLLAATGWILAEPLLRQPSQRLASLALVGATVLLSTRSKISPVVLVALGALAGSLGAV